MTKGQSAKITFYAVSNTTGEPVSTLTSPVVRMSTDGNASQQKQKTIQPVSGIPGAFSLELTASETLCDCLTLSITAQNIEPAVLILTFDPADYAKADSLPPLQTTLTAIQATTGQLSADLSATKSKVDAIPTAQTIAQTCLTTNLATLPIAAPVYSHYTAIMAALKSTVDVGSEENTGTWTIKRPDGTVQRTLTVHTSADAQPIVEVK